MLEGLSPAGGGRTCWIRGPDDQLKVMQANNTDYADTIGFILLAL
jgi:hypothetical protein